VAITTKDLFYILRFDQGAYNAWLESSTEIGDEGVENAFEVVADINERSVYRESKAVLTNIWIRSVKTAKWVEDCFVYTTANNRLNYLVGSESYTITNLDAYVISLSFSQLYTS
jgi:coatomer subunit beta'